MDRQHAPVETGQACELAGRAPMASEGAAGTLTTEEAGEKAAVFKGFKFGCEPDALFGDASLLFDELYLLLDEAIAFDLGPQTVYLCARSVPLLTDLLDLTGTLL